MRGNHFMSFMILYLLVAALAGTPPLPSQTQRKQSRKWMVMVLSLFLHYMLLPPIFCHLLSIFDYRLLTECTLTTTWNPSTNPPPPSVTMHSSTKHPSSQLCVTHTVIVAELEIAVSLTCSYRFIRFMVTRARTYAYSPGLDNIRDEI